MNYSISGELVEKGQEVKISDKFKKLEFVIKKTESNGGMEFTDHIKFQLTQDRCNLVDAFKVGEQMEVTFNVRGKKYEKDGKVSYFINLEAWKVAHLAASDQGAGEIAMTNDIPPISEEDDLPF